jgi:hypothetical protein
MRDNTCWNCGHSFESHVRIEGRCGFETEQGRCDCEGYEDAEYFGHQRKRDLYTLSDRRRLAKRAAR